MANTREILRRMQAITATRQITRAMRMISASKLRKAQHMLEAVTPYIQSLEEVLAAVSVVQEPPACDPASLKLLVVLSSSKGLCGGFHNSLCRYAQACAELGHTEVLVVGQKALQFFRRKPHIPCCTSHVHAHGDTGMKGTEGLATFLEQALVEGRYAEICLVYMQGKSPADQKPCQEVWLSAATVTPWDDDHQEVICEPSKEHIVRQTLYMLRRARLYRAMLVSAVAENGARTVTMGKATDSADTLLQQLHLSYNSKRQASVTGEILEIAAGAEAFTN